MTTLRSPITRVSISTLLPVLDDRALPPENCGVMRVMTPEDGDKKVTWDRTNFDQIREAKDTFDKLIAEGMVAYRVGLDGQRSSDIMVEFDPYAEEIIFVPVGLVRGG